MEDTTEFLDEYQAKFGRRAATTGSVSRNTVSYGSGIKEKPETSISTRPKTVGMFDYSSETQLQFSARFGRRAKLEPVKIQKFTMRSNLRSPGPEVRFEGSSEQMDNFTQKPIIKTEKKYYAHAANIKTFDQKYLKEKATNSERR